MAAAITERNKQIYEMRKEGHTYSEIAKLFNISANRVSQICAHEKRVSFRKKHKHEKEEKTERDKKEDYENFGITGYRYEMLPYLNLSELKNDGVNNIEELKERLNDPGYVVLGEDYSLRNRTNAEVLSWIIGIPLEVRKITTSIERDLITNREIRTVQIVLRKKKK